MHAMTQLKQLREQMVEELTRIPQYRALKAMERFIGEMSAIYEASLDADDADTKDLQHRIAQTIESRVKAEPGPIGVVRTAPSAPVHRVA